MDGWDGYLGAFFNQIWTTVDNYDEPKTIRIVGLSDLTRLSMIKNGMTAPSLSARMWEAVDAYLVLTQMNDENEAKQPLWDVFTSGDEELQRKYNASDLPKRIGFVPNANYALHFDPQWSNAAEQREKHK